MSSQTVFLSCRDEDLPRSEPLRRMLEAAQLTIVGGREAIVSAGLFVACLSAGGYVAEELETAIAELQALEHDRSWLLVVPLDRCDVPALPITSKVTLQDLVVELDEIPLRLVPGQSRGALTTETKTQRITASDGVIVGTHVIGPTGADQHSKAEFGEVVIDHRLTFTGTVVDNRSGNKS